eukprot:1663661-Rhodomonas_salina.2
MKAWRERGKGELSQQPACAHPLSRRCAEEEGPTPRSRKEGHDLCAGRKGGRVMSERMTQHVRQRKRAPSVDAQRDRKGGRRRRRTREKGKGKEIQNDNQKSSPRNSRRRMSEPSSCRQNADESLKTEGGGQERSEGSGRKAHASCWISRAQLHEYLIDIQRTCKH